MIDEDGTQRAVDGEVWALESGNDRAVVTRGDRQQLIVVSTGEEVADLGPVNGGIWPLFTRQVVVAWSPGRLSLFDAIDGALLATGATTVDPIALYVTSSGSVVATVEGSTDAPCCVGGSALRDALTASAVTVPIPVTGFFNGALAPSGNRFSALGDAGHAVIDTVSGQVVVQPVGTLAEFDNSGRYIATGGNRLTVWDVETGEAVFAAPEPVKKLAWSGGCDTDAVCRLATVRRRARPVGARSRASVRCSPTRSTQRRSRCRATDPSSRRAASAGRSPCGVRASCPTTAIRPSSPPRPAVGPRSTPAQGSSPTSTVTRWRSTTGQERPRLAGATDVRIVPGERRAGQRRETVGADRSFVR